MPYITQAERIEKSVLDSYRELIRSRMSLNGLPMEPYYITAPGLPPISKRLALNILAQVSREENLKATERTPVSYRDNCESVDAPTPIPSTQLMTLENLYELRVLEGEQEGNGFSKLKVEAVLTFQQHISPTIVTVCLKSSTLKRHSIVQSRLCCKSELTELKYRSKD